MNALEKIKLINELKKAVDERNAQSNPLKKLVWIKKVQQLRQKLGLLDGRLKNNTQSLITNNKTPKEAYQTADKPTIARRQTF